MDWYVYVLTNYATFHGRARRKEYWMFILWNAIISGVLTAIFTMIAAITNVEAIAFMYLLYPVVVFIPTIAVTIRRLHDTGKGGAWICLYFIPFIGGLALFILMCLDSEQGSNRYGVYSK